MHDAEKELVPGVLEDVGPPRLELSQKTPDAEAQGLQEGASPTLPGTIAESWRQLSGPQRGAVIALAAAKVLMLAAAMALFSGIFSPRWRATGEILIGFYGAAVGVALLLVVWSHVREL